MGSKLSLLTLKNTAKRGASRAARWILRAAARRERGFAELPEAAAPSTAGLPEQVLVVAARLLSGAQVQDWHGQTVLVDGRKFDRRHVRAAKQALSWARAGLRAERDRLAAEREVDPAEIPLQSLRKYLQPMLGRWS